MKAILLQGFGGPEMLGVADVPEPELRPDDLLIRVRAAGVNRADTFQRQGRYDSSFGDSELLGLELAGDVVALGSNVREFEPGQRVFGIVGGGAYAQYARMDRNLAMLMPDRMSYRSAAAIAETYITANEALFGLGNLKGAQSVLIHAGASGVGTAAVQLASHIGADICFTAGSSEKIARVEALGRSSGVNYREADFRDHVLERHPQGVDLVIDFLGASYFEKNLAVLRDGGTLVILSTMGGASAEIDLGAVLRRRLRIVGSVMKSRTIAEKAELTRSFAERWLPLLANEAIRPLIDSVVPIEDVQAAHRRMEANANTGKIVLDLAAWNP